MVNCVLNDCFTNKANKSGKYAGISLFKITSRSGEFYENWRKEVLNIVTTYRVSNADLKQQIEKGNIYFCENHYKSDDIETTPKGRKTLRPGAIPTENLPKKSHSKEPPVERRHLNIVKDVILEQPVAYKSFESVKKGLERLTTSWTVSHQDSFVLVQFFDKEYAIPKYVIRINQDFQFDVAVFNWKLPMDCFVYKEFNKSVQYHKVAAVICKIESAEICQGVLDHEAKTSAIIHTLPKTIDFESSIPYQIHQFFRAKSCHVLQNSDSATMCQGCTSLENECKKRAIIKQNQEQSCIKKKAPLSGTSHARLKATVLQQRASCKFLEDKIKKMDAEIIKSSVKLDNQLSDDINTIMSENLETASPFMQLFWKEQTKNFTQGAKKYHPMVIRFCLSIAAKSSSAYDELRKSGVLCLPSQRTLRDYRNAVRPQTGFNPAVIDELKSMIVNLVGHQRYVCLSFDEMKISDGLVYDKYSGDLIGFTDLGDKETNEACLEKENTLATHALLFYIRGLSSDLCFPLAYFATETLTCTQIMPLFWKCVAILELNCNLWVIAAISDGASPNRKFFQLHQMLDGKADAGVIYRTVNLFKPTRFVYFFSDAPHLVKTSRNCLYNSRANLNEGTRCMWNNDKYMVWSHISDLYHADVERGLKLLPKLSHDHVKLTSYSKMKVRLAVQVLSCSVAAVLRKFSPTMCLATADFCGKMDGFFDCLNVRNLKEHKMKKKPFLKPYTSQDDERLSWLKKDFLGYIDEWKKSIDERPGEFTNDQKEKMFISKQTYIGLKTTTLSVIECIKFLLSEGMPYVLTEKFNQDDCEEYFGRQRSLGRRNDNPTIQQFGYNNNTIRIQRSVRTTTGNTSGKYGGLKKNSSWFHVDDEPLKKRTRNAKSEQQETISN